MSVLYTCILDKDFELTDVKQVQSVIDRFQSFRIQELHCEEGVGVLRDGVNGEMTLTAF